MISRIYTLIVGISTVTVLATANGHTDRSFGPCITPKDQSGKCIEVSSCSEIVNLLHKDFKLMEDIHYLRSSQCGSHNRVPLVCCSDKHQAVDDPTSPPPMPSPAERECGRVFQERIVGGTKTAFDEFPWTVLLEYRNGYKCGGSLISKRYVLTAAHCVAKKKPIRVRLGEWDTSTDPDCMVDRRGRKICADSHIDVGVQRIISHPRYQRWSRNQHYDIALLRLDRDVGFTDYIQPICLSPANASERDSTAGIVMDVAGWGRTENYTKSTQKLKLALSVVSKEDCQSVYRRKVQFISSQICAGGVKGQDSCSGDSGGPLMAVDMLNGEQYTYLAGVVSFGPTPCGMEGWPGVYTKVSEFMDWILENITA